MSTIGWLTLTCDGCPRTTVIRFEKDIETARKYARNRGWILGTVDTCPRHIGRKRT